MEIPGYKIESILGQGGMATVYLAFDETFETQVALKVLAPQYLVNDEIRGRFLAEAKTMFRLSHPNVIKVNGMVNQPTCVAFAMDLVEGVDLKRWLDNRNDHKATEKQIVEVFCDMLQGVVYIHSQGIIHRDLKPSNFMISNVGGVKLMDFGIAKLSAFGDFGLETTRTTAQMGTPRYMSPEQVRSSAEVDARSDVYSLGVILWELMAGKNPYGDVASAFEIHVKIVNESLPRISSTWDEIIARATQKSPNDRYASATEFLGAVQALLSGLGEPSMPKKGDATILQVEKTPPAESTILESGPKTVIESGPTAPRNHLRIDGVQYGLVTINGRRWLSADLRATHYVDGETVFVAQSNSDWTYEINPWMPMRSHGRVMTDNGVKVYNWWAALTDMAPPGWRLPTKDEWAEALGMKDSKLWLKRKVPGQILETLNTKGGYRLRKTTDIKKRIFGAQWRSWNDATPYWTATVDCSAPLEAYIVWVGEKGARIDRVHPSSGAFVRFIECEPGEDSWRGKEFIEVDENSEYASLHEALEREYGDLEDFYAEATREKTLTYEKLIATANGFEELQNNFKWSEKKLEHVLKFLNNFDLPIDDAEDWNEGIYFDGGAFSPGKHGIAVVGIKKSGQQHVIVCVKCISNSMHTVVCVNNHSEELSVPTLSSVERIGEKPGWFGTRPMRFHYRESGQSKYVDYQLASQYWELYDFIKAVTSCEHFQLVG